MYFVPEGRYVAERLFSKTPPRDLSYNNLSTIMFLEPTVASSGTNETALQKKKIPYRVATVYYGIVSRAIAKGGSHGFVKLLTSHDDAMTILGS
jgi:dihydrolipoamide dehydrogenase